MTARRILCLETYGAFTINDGPSSRITVSMVYTRVRVHICRHTPVQTIDTVIRDDGRSLIVNAALIAIKILCASRRRVAKHSSVAALTAVRRNADGSEDNIHS